MPLDQVESKDLIVMVKLRLLCLSAFFLLPFAGDALHAQAIPKTKEILDRLDAIALGEKDLLRSVILRYIAADLRRGCQAWKIKRKAKMGPTIPGRTTGEDGTSGGALLPGWGPRQLIFIGDTALRLLAKNVCERCVETFKLQATDKVCFLKDAAILTLLHEWLHVHQRSPVPLDDAARKATECDAITFQCEWARHFATDIPKYGVVPGVPQPGCTLGRLMLMEYKSCKAEKKKVWK